MIRFESSLQISMVMLLASLLFTACLNDSASPTVDLEATDFPDTSISLPTPSPAPSPTPTVSSAPWVSDLLIPQAPTPASPTLYFLDGPNAHVLNGEDLSVAQATRQRRLRVVATIPGSTTAAIVLIGSAGGRETEEIRIIDQEDNESEPVYGPEIVGDPAGNPRINTLTWSPDGKFLAIVRDDNSVWLASDDFPAQPLDTSLPDNEIEQIHWSPSGSALALLYRTTDGAGTIRIVSVEQDGSFDILPIKSFGNVCWLPDPAMLIVAEDSGAGQNPNAGSLFTMLPDGSARQLLVSAGEYGPAIRIGQLECSPDGARAAFTVETPGPDGAFQFQALYLLDVGTGVRRELDVSPGLGVTDLWWLESGLVWRATDPALGSTYSGVEPFVIEHAVFDSDDTNLVYANDGR